MKLKFYHVLILLPFFTFSQELHFDLFPLSNTQSQITYDFDHLGTANINHFDMDNDGDQDVLLCDYSENTYYGLVKLYRNDGNGSFKEIDNNPFQQVERASADVADIDNDNDLDIIVIGRNINTPLTKLYRNECGYFYPDTLSSFVNYEHGNPVFADIDNDNDPDLLLTGVTGFTMEPSRLYKNDGNGVFTLFNSSSLPHSGLGSADFGDIDNDGDLDLLLTGEKVSGIYADLYVNNGNGNFNSIPDNFKNVYYSDAEFGDVDNDGDLDAIIIGQTAYSGVETRKYINNGSGVFSFSFNSGLTSVGYGNVKFSDLDNDNDLDLIIMGSSTTSNSVKFYKNNGSGVFNFTSGNNFPHWSDKGLGVFDIDNDNDNDILTISDKIEGMIHVNNGSAQFQTIPYSSFSKVNYSSADFADIDNDSDLDLLLTGSMYPPGGNTPNGITNLYINDGLGQFTNQNSIPFPNMYYGDNDFADVDGDNDLDLFMSGYSDIAPFKRADLYLNNGTGIFSISPSVFTPVVNSSAAFFDVDGDTDKDLLVLGSNSANLPTTNLYINNGNGVFVDDTSCAIQDLKFGSISYGDIDGDTDLDLIVTGINTSATSFTGLYKNNGSGIFLLSNSSFPAVQKGMVDMADIDNDNDLDVFLSGDNGGLISSEIYTNDGLGNFTLTLSGIESLKNGNGRFSDIDNDNDEDLIYQGTNSGLIKHLIYLNDGLGNYTVVNNTHIKGHLYGSLEIADVNNDSLKDIFVCGGLFGGIGSNLYKQKTCSSFYTSVNVSICDVYYSPLGFQYTTSGTYTETYTALNGCDSIITYCVEILNEGGPTIITESACESFTSSTGTLFTLSGIYSDTLSNIFGCDSIITLNLTINQNSLNSIIVEACESYTSPSGQIFYTSGIYVDTIQTFLGCDSIITIDLTIFPNTTSSITATECDSYISNTGQIYSSSGIYYDTLQNTLGCDSIVITNLTINQSSIDSIVVNECLNYISPSGIIYTNSGLYFDTIQSITGCDSIFIIDLTIHQNSSSTIFVEECGIYISPSGQFFSNSGTYNDTILNFEGCDSIITINLTINQNSFNSIIVQECESYTSPSGQIFYTSGTYVDTIQTFLGCDSIITIDLTIFPNTTTSITATECDSYISNTGQIYSSSGIYYDTLQNTLGCDSIVITNLTINQSSIDSIVVNECLNYISPSGIIYTNSGLYFDTIQSITGCDSIFIIDLTIHQNSSSTIFVEECGIYISPSGQSISSSGIYSASIPNSQNCDSLITLNVTIHDIDNTVYQVDNLTLQSNEAGAQYQWLSCQPSGNFITLNGETDQVFVATYDGEYAVIVSNASCTDTSSCYLINSVSVENKVDSHVISVFPNPSIGIYNLFVDNVNIDKVEVLDVLGRLVYFDKENVNLIDLSHLVNGIYNISVFIGEVKYTIQVIKC